MWEIIPGLQGATEDPWDCVDGEGKAADKEASNEGMYQGLPRASIDQS